MKLVVTCPNKACRKQLQISTDASAGRKVRCPACNLVFAWQVPEPATLSLQPGVNQPVAPDETHSIKRQSDPGETRSISQPVDPGETRSLPGKQVEPTNPRPLASAPELSGSRYRILRPHARGGLGEVFLADDGELHREVALKEIQAHRADDAGSRARFVLEAEITGGLEHPGIVPVYGLGIYADGRPFYAMRFIRGDSLKKAIEKYHAPAGADEDSRPDLRKLLRRLIDVCNAMQYAHDRGVIHRDLKPANIMLGQYGETLVVDWGLAKATGKSDSETGAEAPLRPQSAGNSSETVAGSAVGTPGFMSPEQAGGRLDEVGPASDIYSLGATLYCVLTGRPPQIDPEILAVLMKIQRGEFPRPAQLRPGIDRALEAVCLKAMALAPRTATLRHGPWGTTSSAWLADEPVSAWPEPWSVRCARCAWTAPHAGDRNRGGPGRRPGQLDRFHRLAQCGQRRAFPQTIGTAAGQQQPRAKNAGPGGCQP